MSTSSFDGCPEGHHGLLSEGSGWTTPSEQSVATQSDYAGAYIRPAQAATLTRRRSLSDPGAGRQGPSPCRLREAAATRCWARCETLPSFLADHGCSACRRLPEAPEKRGGSPGSPTRSSGDQARDARRASAEPKDVQASKLTPQDSEERTGRARQALWTGANTQEERCAGPALWCRLQCSQG